MTAENETREANNPRNWQSANCLKGFVSKSIITSKFNICFAGGQRRRISTVAQCVFLVRVQKIPTDAP